MVTFKLMEETEQFLLYWYFPNGNGKTHGILLIYKDSGQVELQTVAPNDVGRSGRIPMYANHAIRVIVKAWAEGVILKDGSAAWY